MVAEILLQQTFARKVVPVYERIIQKYPSLIDLASASQSDLKFIIQPLGLLYRAEVLISASNQIINDFGGTIPKTKKDLLKIKYIGPYIASAILCYAFNFKVVPIDTNVNRIVCRIFGLEYPVKKTATRKSVESLCHILILPSKKNSRLNYALLDYAAEICKYYNPNCKICKVSKICQHYSLNAIF
jgi:A/G-specific adenine glycosylase